MRNVLCTSKYEEAIAREIRGQLGTLNIQSLVGEGGHGCVVFMGPSNSSSFWRREKKHTHTHQTRVPENSIHMGYECLALFMIPWGGQQGRPTFPKSTRGTTVFLSLALMAVSPHQMSSSAYMSYPASKRESLTEDQHGYLCKSPSEPVA